MIREENEAEIQKQKEEIAKLEKEKVELEHQMVATRAILEQCQENNARPLRYRDLYDGGILSKHIDAFTLFDTIEQNDAFLELINYADGSAGSSSEGDGLCDNLRVYSKVPWAEQSVETQPPSLNPNSEEYIKHLRLSKAAWINGLTWRDDYLAFCIYIRAGTTQKFAASLCGI